MPLECGIGDCVAVVLTRPDSEERKTGRNYVLLRLNDPNGERLSEIKVPWPDGEPEPCEVQYRDSEECVRLTNNATFADIPLRVSRLREVVANRRQRSPPKRFSSFSSTPCPVEESNQKKLHSALKDFVKEPLENGKWKHALKYLSAKNANADGFLTKDEQTVILHFLPTQSFSSKELKNICEVLRRTNVFGLSCLASFYELCLSLDQVALVRSAIESTDALSEQCLAVLLDFVASKSSEDDADSDYLLAHLLTRHFDPRLMTDAAARKITIQNASILMQKCMNLYVSPEHGNIAEEALSLMTVLTDVFGSRLVWENDLHHVAEEALEFSERLSEIVSLFNQIEVQQKYSERKRGEEESQAQYRIEKISLPRRPLNW
nr:Protein Y57A10A.27 [Haemonchus contortus]